MILHYIKMAVRSLMKHPWQNLIALVGLAVALFCFSVCLYFSRYIYTTDICFPNKERILEISFYDPADERSFSTTGGMISGRNTPMSSSCAESFCLWQRSVC